MERVVKFENRNESSTNRVWQTVELFQKNGEWFVKQRWTARRRRVMGVW